MYPMYTGKYTNKNTQSISTQHIHNSTKNRLARFQLATRRAEVFTWENNQPARPRSRSLNRDLGGAGWPVSSPFPARLSYKHFCYLLCKSCLPEISGIRDGPDRRAGSLPYKHPLKFRSYGYEVSSSLAKRFFKLVIHTHAHSKCPCSLF